MLLRHCCSRSFPLRSLLHFSSQASASAATTEPPPQFFPFGEPAAALNLDVSQVVPYFKDWFLSADAASIADHRDTSLLDRVYAALSSAADDNDHSLDSALSQLRLPLSESFILSVLRHRPRNFFSDERRLLFLRLKFFDWSGRPHYLRSSPYRHTRSTYHAVFRLLARAGLAPLLLDWLRVFRSHPASGLARIHDTLIVGYAIAGRAELALDMFAHLRFQGLDLDLFSYHVLINSLVESSIYDSAEALLAQVESRGVANTVTSAIKLKSLCYQGHIDHAISYLTQLQSFPCTHHLVSDHLVGILIQALSSHKRYHDAGRIMDMLADPSAAYSTWIKALVAADQLTDAVGFMEAKHATEDYVPESFHYNALIYGLLRHNRLKEVYDLLIQMRKQGVLPDRNTMNATLCFFCKAGMVDVALQLYKSRTDLGFVLNRLAYNCLVAGLTRAGGADEVCQIIEDSIKHGHFPVRKAFNTLAIVLCRERKLDMVQKLLDAAIQRNIQPNAALYAGYIAALSKAREIEQVSLVQRMASNSRFSASIGQYKYMYTSLIYACIELRRVDALPGLIIEMQENGHVPSPNLYRQAICCLCEEDRYDDIYSLLNKQLERKEIDRKTCYNYFIGGASRAKEPDLARGIYDLMEHSGILPNRDTNFLMLQSYLKKKRIGDALNFFNFLCVKRESRTKLYNIFISGLCEAGKAEQALVYWKEMRDKRLVPSLKCYEELAIALCSSGDYNSVVRVLKDFCETGRPVSSFLCNVLLLHCLKGLQLRHAWLQFAQDSDHKLDKKHSSGPVFFMLGQLINAFSGGIRLTTNLEDLDEVVERLFPVDIYTYNMLLRGLIMAKRMDCACNLFHKLRRKGIEPNSWSFDIMVHGFCKEGRRKDAERWLKAMYQNGFHPTWYTINLYNNTC